MSAGREARLRPNSEPRPRWATSNGTWRLERADTALLLGAGALAVEPKSSHGVHLHISRYHFP